MEDHHLVIKATVVERPLPSPGNTLPGNVVTSTKRSPMGLWKGSLMLTHLLGFLCSYLVLTNQTTYELVRRRRIPYLRDVPDNVYLFSRGICRNLCYFCCSRDSAYVLERVPTREELEARTRPYTCIDVLCARCC
ncbi:hypothetical protein Taro_040399 [Colocasia esculenta]|uniref:Uncharacterized protein n=1 Tax=Colocasia esculenta TaxID=4460 RepID=A0A843WSX0_COLES|nr:hypothetical protein [Colocasia esculenta]